MGARLHGRVGCFTRAAAFSFCCHSPFNAECWRRNGLSYELCCSLAPWNDNDRLIPFYHEPVLSLQLRSGSNLSIYQATEDFHLRRTPTDVVRSYGSGYL